MAMSPAKHRRVEDPPPPPVPVDLLLEIFARLDVATIVRCAATCKAVRRAILDDDSPAPLGRRLVSNGALLLGVSYAFLEHKRSDRVRSVGQVPRRSLRFDAGVLTWVEPVASRGGLIVLRCRRNYPHLYVRNALTGRITSWLPHHHVSDDYPPALLAVGDAGRSFQLLVSDVSLRTQVFSSESGEWGPVAQVAGGLPPGFPRSAPRRGSHPVVLGGGAAVCWLHSRDQCVIRLDIGKAQATLIELPRRVRLCYHAYDYDHMALQLASASSADGELSLLVAGVRVISMWTLSAAAAEEDGAGSSSAAASRWTRQVLIERETIGREDLSGGYSAHFLGFGELSGMAILLMDQIGLVRINLRTKEAIVLGSDGFKGVDAGTLQLCLHETDLPSLLRAMRSF
ncbi:unnamed protein product [Urochloa decumbens]|uniref:F-box domain-containing protein n=1 Tax=Urochloa decumbens TaxID=240449 RepID=A0ABC8X3A9_9POAL